MTDSILIEFAYERNLNLGGSMGKRGRPRQQAEVIEADPLKRAEELLKEFETEAGVALLQASNAVGDVAIDKALAEAGESYRRAYSFGCALSQATGRNIYRRQWDFQARLNDFLRRRWVGIKHGPSVALALVPTEALEILEQLAGMAPGPKLFEGEAEYRQMLAAKELIEVDDNDYTSRSRPARFPSID